MDDSNALSILDGLNVTRFARSSCRNLATLSYLVDACENMDKRIPKLPKIRLYAMENYSDSEFINRFRLSKTAARYVHDLINDGIDEYFEQRGDPVLSMDRFLITLRYYATGCFQKVLADLNGISQSTVCRIVNDTTWDIANLCKDFIRLPDPIKQEANATKFFSMHSFPRIFGLIDGCHIPCAKPAGTNSEVFRNRKGSFSINCQIVCGPDMEIQDLVARCPGSTHDQMILNISPLKEKCERNFFAHYFILGDNGYKNKKYLLTPLRRPLTRAQRRYNRRHKRTRNLVERCFGVWKQRFPTLSKKTTQALRNRLLTITACAILHNIAIEFKIPIPQTNDVPPVPFALPEDEVMYEENQGDNVVKAWAQFGIGDSSQRNFLFPSNSKGAKHMYLNASGHNEARESGRNRAAIVQSPSRSRVSSFTHISPFPLGCLHLLIISATLVPK